MDGLYTPARLKGLIAANLNPGNYRYGFTLGNTGGSMYALMLWYTFGIPMVDSTNTRILDIIWVVFMAWESGVMSESIKKSWHCTHSLHIMEAANIL